MKRTIIVYIITILSAASLHASRLDTLYNQKTAAITTGTDTISEASAGMHATSSDWWTDRIKSHTFDISDTTIIYPKFLKFCVNTYNWGDRLLNTYDHDYVLPTGKNGKY